MNLDPSAQTPSGIDLKAFADERSIVYLIRPSGASQGAAGKIVCICFDGDASVNHWNASMGIKQSQLVLRPAHAKQESMFEDTKSIFSLPMEDLSVPEAPEGAWRAYSTVWDNYPDAPDLDLDEVLGEWASESSI